uniref:RBR-type E3 ubiquitin transferase n=1 Tax=Caenorhabditis tropicalis TaxID=1561998 RepID=A0A1I7UFF8_9PELO
MSSDDEIYMDSESEEEQEEEVEDQILDEKGLRADMKQQIAEIQSTVEVSEGVGRLLLQKHKWNKDSLTDKFYESPDRITFLIESNVHPKECVPVETGEGDCDICCETTELVGLSCNHRCCKECWNSYLTEKIKEGQSEIECMDSRCKLLLDDEKVEEFLTDSSIIATFHRLILNKYVSSNVFLKWCPGVDCGKAVKSTHCDPHLVTCTCGTGFCFYCTNEWHDPVNCHHMRLWMKKCGENAETATWIINNTKDCPKCLAQIEKNGGCNYIRCTNPACGYQFCWICMNSWSVHAQAWYNCSSFDQAAESNREKYRTNLDRYIFYYNRYRGHQQSLKLESKLIRKVEKKMDKMQEKGMSFSDVQCLRHAVDVLSVCRQTMMLTYVFAYYLDKNNHSLIFEANQKDLEMATEQLSGFLERELEDEDLTTLKQSVQDKSRYVEHRRKRLLDHCADGNEQNHWVFIE